MEQKTRSGSAYEREIRVMLIVVSKKSDIRKNLSEISILIDYLRSDKTVKIAPNVGVVVLA
jgi:hypothetical protein